MESDKLVEIQPKDWMELRNIFLLNWPDNHVAWHTINNFLNWFRVKPDIKHLKILSLNGSWRSDGTYVIVDRYQLFVYTLELSNDKLKRALSLLDWSSGFKVSSFLKRHRSAVLDVVQEKKLKVEYDSHTLLYFLSKDEAKKKILFAPSNVTLKPLSVDSAEVVDNEWPNKHDGSRFFIERLIEWNPNIGAFNENNELMAWCLRLQAGSLGALQVRQKFFRKGLGSLVVTAMCKILANSEMDTFALVGTQNAASQNLFKKLGFNYADDAFWLRTFPTTPFEQNLKWSDN